LSFLLFFVFYSFGQNEPFDYLKKLEIDNGTNYFVRYNESLSTIINERLSEPFKGEDFYPEMLSGDINLMLTRLSSSDNTEYYVIFSEGMSIDPTFYFFKKDNTRESAFSVGGEQLFMTGNGSFYVQGHANKMYNQKRKFKVVNGEFKEVEQPFYYVGLKTKTLKPIKLYDSKEKNRQLASLPAEYEIEVLLNEFTNDESLFYLIRTSFGLTGWIELPKDGWKGTYIKGLYFQGD
jgi:hypothetical protein